MTRNFAWLFVLLLLSACGSSGELEVRLRALDGEDPFNGVSTLLVRLLGEGGDELLSETSNAVNGFALRELERPEASELRVNVEGFAADAQTLVSSGQVRLAEPDHAGACCVVLCFCLEASAAACDCGDGSCGACSP